MRADLWKTVMKCPFCGKTESEVIESRIVEEGEAVRRRRKCLGCDKRFTTYEKVRNNALWVIKKDGKREAFEKDKLRRGILRAIEKRQVPLAKIDELVDEVEREMLRQAKDEIPSRSIGSAVLKRLKKLDKVAWLRFASVYMEFEDLTDFEKAISKLTVRN